MNQQPLPNKVKIALNSEQECEKLAKKIKKGIQWGDNNPEKEEGPGWNELPKYATIDKDGKLGIDFPFKHYGKHDRPVIGLFQGAGLGIMSILTGLMFISGYVNMVGETGSGVWELFIVIMFISLIISAYKSVDEFINIYEQREYREYKKALDEVWAYGQARAEARRS